MWPFRRNPKPQPRRFVEPKETWAAGDIAECIATLVGSGKNIAPPPAIGAIGIVLSVISGEVVGTSLDGVGLRITGHPDHWQANCFRKIVQAESYADRKVSDKLPVRRKADA